MRRLRSQILRQIGEKPQGILGGFPRIFRQYDGKDASKMRTKPWRDLISGSQNCEVTQYEADEEAAGSGGGTL